jgi:hypothetical protein
MVIRAHLTETERWAILGALTTAVNEYRKSADVPNLPKDLRQQLADGADHLIALRRRLEAAETITLSEPAD